MNWIHTIVVKDWLSCIKWNKNDGLLRDFYNKLNSIANC